MVIALLVAGIVSVLAGLAAIVYGVQYKDFGFGNTLIVVGATAICTGMLLAGLWVVVGELRQIARRLIPRTAAESRGRPGLPAPGALRVADAGLAFGRDEAADAEDLETAAPPLSALPWQDEAAPRERPRMPPLPEFNPEPAPLRIGRDRPFPPTRRERDRDRTAPRSAEPLALDTGAAEAAPSASVNFENAWPKPERMRPSEAEVPRRSARPSSRFTDLASEDRSASTIIKSGVVDGMAYSLYSDGSIEAQMPEGMMRFGSIEELRAHLGQR
jgi:hypothetical protein